MTVTDEVQRLKALVDFRMNQAQTAVSSMSGSDLDLAVEYMRHTVGQIEDMASDLAKMATDQGGENATS